MTTAPAPIVCPQCDTQLAPNLLSCPVCKRLVHADLLKDLAARAERANGEGNVTEALALWRQALDLLPADSHQHQAVAAKIADLSARVDAPAVKAKPRGKLAAKAGVVGTAALVLWKFKLALIFILTKGKLLLLGLTKASTLFSMLLSLGVYWAAWGWKFALGLVLSIYVHEMGHVAMLRRYGIKATAPMFIPGLGALVMMKQHPATPTESARVGLAGPVWGAGAAVAAYLVSLAMDWPSWAAIARVGAWINLFNLLPVWQLDGGRAFSGLTRAQRWIIVVVMTAAWIFTKEGLLLLLLIVAAFRAFSKPEVDKPDHATFAELVFLIVLLSWMCLVPIRLPDAP